MINSCFAVFCCLYLNEEVLLNGFSPRLSWKTKMRVTFHAVVVLHLLMSDWHVPFLAVVVSISHEWSVINVEKGSKIYLRYAVTWTKQWTEWQQMTSVCCHSVHARWFIELASWPLCIESMSLHHKVLMLLHNKWHIFEINCFLFERLRAQNSSCFFSASIPFFFSFVKAALPGMELVPPVVQLWRNSPGSEDFGDLPRLIVLE